MACTLGWLALPLPNGGIEIPLLDQPKPVLLCLVRLFAAIPIAEFKVIQGRLVELAARHSRRLAQAVLMVRRLQQTEPCGSAGCFCKEKNNRKTMKKIIRVALSFATFPNDELNSFLILLLVCLKNNPLFPNLPVAYASLLTLVTTYQTNLAAAKIGGPKDTAALTEARDAVISALRQIAGYIQSLGLTNESDVLSSGFDIIVPGKNPQSPLDQPKASLDNSMPGRLAIYLQAVPNAKAYHAQYCIGAGAWVDLGIFPSTRNMVIPGTLAGTVYSVRVQAIGGSTQYSPWSAVISLMST